MKYDDPEILTKICDLVLAGNSFNKAAKRSGISVATLFRWIAESMEQPEKFTFEWGPFGLDTFKGHLRTANAGCVANIESEILAAASGRSDLQKEPVFFQGRPQFKEREDIILAGDGDADPATLMLLYGQPDKYERNVRGERVQLYIMRAPSDALRLATMKAKNPKGGWGDHRDVNVRMSGGVKVIGGETRKPAIAAPTPVEAVIAQAVEVTAQEEIANVALVPDTAEPVAEPAPEVAEVSAALDPVARVEADRADNVRPGGKSPLRADLEAQLARVNARNKEKVAEQTAAAPPGYVRLADRPDQAWKLGTPRNEDEGVGKGTVRPGGVRTR